MEYINPRLPGEQSISKIYRNEQMLDGKTDQGIFDIYELDNVYERIGNRVYERNVVLGNTLSSYTDWTNVKEEAGYGIWKYPITDFVDNDVNELYINNIKLDYVGVADSESTPVGFTRVFLTDNKRSGEGFTDVTSAVSSLSGTPVALGTTNDYIVEVTPTLSGIDLDYINIINGSVTVQTTASAVEYKLYVEDEDYEMDYINGKISLVSGTTISGVVEVSYSVGDGIYVGLTGSEFDSISVGLTQRGVGNMYRYTYYLSGTGWSYFKPDIDGSNGFSNNGNIRFSGLTGWGSTTVNSQNLYYIKLDLTTQGIVEPTCNYMLKATGSVVELLKTTTKDLLEYSYKWCFYDDNVYVAIPNNGADNKEGNTYIKESSLTDNKKNYFIYNNIYIMNYRNSETDDALNLDGKDIDDAGTITATSFVGSITGNADTATTLQTTRTIWGQNFNGSANVTGAVSGATTITASGKIETINTGADSIKTAGGIKTTIASDTDSDTGDILTTTISNTEYGLVIVRESTDSDTAVFLIGGGNIELVTGITSNFSTTKDTINKYNIYYESNVIKLQNKVGDNKNIAIGLYVV